MVRDPVTLVALIAALTASAFWLESRFRWAQQIGASMLIILAGAALSNTGLVPLGSPVYELITGPVTSLAIIWLLFAIDLRGLRAAGPAMLLAFAVAVVATCAGALTAALMLGTTFGDQGWRLAGVMTGTYAGGSLNFVAVGREVGLEQSVFTAATAADNLMTAVWVGATLMLPLWLGPAFRRRAGGGPRPGDAPDPAGAHPFARGWRHLALPGIMADLLGYAVGNYAGLAMAAVVRQLLG